MKFLESETHKNLARAFAGESQARNRYDFLAEEFSDVGYRAVYDKLSQLAKEEEAHGKIFYDFILDNIGSNMHIEINAAYPYKKGDLTQCLKNSVEDERAEAENIYPMFSEIAKKEGYNQIAVAFANIAKIETRHKDFLESLAERLENGTLYKNSVITEYRCTNCGYTINALDAFKVCPVCHHNQGYVDV